MKWVNYILAFYMVLLSAVPCCAFDDCPDDKTVSSLPGHEKNDEDDCGSCSPFFNCEGCAVSIIDLPIVSFEIAKITVKRTYTNLLVSPLPSSHPDFWQPPRESLS